MPRIPLPFVGPAGKLLDRIVALASEGIDPPGLSFAFSNLCDEDVGALESIQQTLSGFFKARAIREGQPRQELRLPVVRLDQCRRPVVVGVVDFGVDGHDEVRQLSFWTAS